ncbi:hypothetical protein DSO57_1033273 [Entomophthora muscae]|uniref:Uncharacterized protein n=1 Tax=Entomophthora muscae TaxID=34485 RepID=A0ACC2TAX1_9FUNG|nr:hypothetical protein DSO57_1033273 [Entomophthora muscae]
MYTAVMFKAPGGIEPSPSRQAGLAGGGDSPAPGFTSKSKNPGSGTIPCPGGSCGACSGPQKLCPSLGGFGWAWSG